MTAAAFGVKPKDGVEQNAESLEIIADLDAYLADFAKPISCDKPGTGFILGNTKCLKCGAGLGGMLGSFKWGICHGEGFCGQCKWPARGYHYIKDRHGVNLFDRRVEMILQYHPDKVKKR